MKTSLETGIPLDRAHTHPTPCVRTQPQDVFRHSGQFMGRFSDQIYLFVLIWYLLTNTHSAIQVGIFLICGAIPVAVISPFSGFIARRYHRLKLLAALNLFRCILVLIIAGSFYSHCASIWLLDAGAAMLGIAGAIYNPIQTSILPNMLTLEHIYPAVGEQFWRNMGALTGALAGGLFYNTKSISFILMISAISYMVAALLECWFPVPASETVFKDDHSYKLPTGISPVQPITGGIGRSPALRVRLSNYTEHQRLFSVIGSFLLANLFLWPVLMIVIPYLFKIVFKLSSLEFGLTQGAYWAGVVIGITVFMSEPPKERLRNILLTNYFITGILMFLLALPLLPAVKAGLTVWSITIIDILLAIFLGLVMVTVNVRIGAYLQTRLNDDYRDQIRVWFGSMMAVIGSISFLIGGLLSEFVPVYWLFIGGALGMGLILAIEVILWRNEVF